MPERVARAPREDLQAPVCVRRHGDVAADETAPGGPARPEAGAARRGERHAGSRQRDLLDLGARGGAVPPAARGRRRVPEARAPGACEEIFGVAAVLVALQIEATICLLDRALVVLARQ